MMFNICNTHGILNRAYILVADTRTVHNGIHSVKLNTNYLQLPKFITGITWSTDVFNLFIQI